MKVEPREKRIDRLLAIHKHPCLDEEAHYKVGRVHLPVALKCNILCNYCDRKVGHYYHSSQPGIASKLMSPEESVEWLKELVRKDPSIQVVGIAGPGEPLANEETFETFRLINTEPHDLTLCLCTNGLFLPDRVDTLKQLGLEHLSITINAVDEKVAAQIHPYVLFGGEKYEGIEGARLLIERQLSGLEKAAEAGFLIKINSVLVPNINPDYLKEVAQEVSRRGAALMNVMPLIPSGGFASLRPPTCEEINRVRDECEKLLPQFKACRQCRADAHGIPGLEG